MRLKVFFDGGCRPNPGRIEVAVVLRGVAHILDDLGHGDNRDAEWLALLQAVALTQGLGPVTLIGDAAEVIAQARHVVGGGAPMHRHAARLQAMMAAMMATGPRPGLRWIRRAQNLAGIALAKRHPR